MSSSMVGRILGYLNKREVLKEVPRNIISVRKRQRLRPYGSLVAYAVRKPKDYDVLEAHRRATAQNAAMFLDALKERMRFAIKAIQGDGGSEFEAEFEKQCQRRRIKLFVLPPRSPKLNGSVERAQRTHTEEFYEVREFSLQIGALNRELQGWEKTYNTIRPHQALGYLTPQEFLLKWQAEKKGGYLRSGDKEIVAYKQNAEAVFDGGGSTPTKNCSTGLRTRLL